jgi:hypothetical protein
VALAYYDITTAQQLTTLQGVLTATDVTLGYLAADGVTPTPKQGIDAATGKPAAPGVGQTVRWAQLSAHPVTPGRFYLQVDQFISATVAAGKVAGLASLPVPGPLDASWIPPLLPGVVANVA